MDFLFPYEVKENRFMRCCGVVDKVKTRDDKVTKIGIKWDK